MKQQGKNLSSNEKWRENVTKAAKRRSLDHPNWIETMKQVMQERLEDPVFKENHLIGITVEGYWYGNKSLIKWNNGGNNRNKYCELWNNDLKRRIDAAYNFKSIISGKDKFDNRNKYLDRHHIYWQEKACCIWDEDLEGYYAWINNGTTAKPIWIKYYIKGDPNKFVLLTHSEHGKMYGNKKEGTDKIYWIKYLEDLIEQREREGKKCYLSKEEYEIYKIKNKETIEKYKNK
jgi:hypothetical protein